MNPEGFKPGYIIRTAKHKDLLEIFRDIDLVVICDFSEYTDHIYVDTSQLQFGSLYGSCVNKDKILNCIKQINLDKIPDDLKGGGAFTVNGRVVSHSVRHIDRIVSTEAYIGQPSKPIISKPTSKISDLGRFLSGIDKVRNHKPGNSGLEFL